MAAKQAAKKTSTDKSLATTGQKTDVSSGKEVDLALVNEAYEKLEGIFKKHIVMAMLEAGQYLIKKFYANSFDNAKINKKAEVKSLSELIRKLQNNAGASPSKTWIYDAVKLAVDDHFFKENDYYKQIGHSHKVAITHVSKPEDKEMLFVETVEKNYTVAKLKERIREVNGGIVPNDLPSDEELKKRKKSELFYLQNQINIRLENASEAIKKYSPYKTRIDAIIDEFKYVRRTRKKRNED